MKSFRLILTIVASFALIAGFSFAADAQAPAPQKCEGCAKPDKDGKKCTKECCATAAKDGKTCKKCTKECCAAATEDGKTDKKCPTKQEKKDEKK